MSKEVSCQWYKHEKGLWYALVESEPIASIIIAQTTSETTLLDPIRENDDGNDDKTNKLRVGGP